jgi:hypothetical protein
MTRLYGASLSRSANRRMTAQERDQFLAEREQAGLKIAPATAEVSRTWGPPFDPYGIVGEENLPPTCQGYGSTKLYWACSPGSDIWVEFGDLPDETRMALRELLKTGRKSLTVYNQWAEAADVGLGVTSSGEQTAASTQT